MSPLDSFLFLGATVGALWGLWLLLNVVFDCISDYHFARAQARTEDLAKPSRGAEESW